MISSRESEKLSSPETALYLSSIVSVSAAVALYL